MFLTADVKVIQKTNLNQYFIKCVFYMNCFQSLCRGSKMNHNIQVVLQEMRQYDHKHIIFFSSYPIT